MCDCKVYEICPECAPSPEYYEKMVEYWWNSDKRVTPEKAAEWDKLREEED